MYKVQQDSGGSEQSLLDLDSIARQGAGRMLAEAPEAGLPTTSRQPGGATRTGTRWCGKTATQETRGLPRGGLRGGRGSSGQRP